MIHLMLLVLLSTCCVAIADNQLDVSPEGRAACPGESITYTCIRYDTNTLRWRFDGTPVRTFQIDDATGVPLELSIMGVEFTVTLTEIDKEMVSSITANVTSTLMVTASPALDGRMITCDAGVGTTADNPMIDSDSLSTCVPIIASITQVGPNQVNVTINEPTEAPNCVADYIIQYGNETVSTGVGQVTGVVITEDDTDPTNLAVLVEWTEPENGGGCACISNYSIAIDGQEISTTGQCGDPQVVVPESEVGGRCDDHSLTITPVLQTGTSGKNSDPVEFPFIFGNTGFPSPEQVEAKVYCSAEQWNVIVNWKSFLLIDDYTPFSITLSHGLNTNDLEMMETGATNTSTVMLNYAVYEALYLNQDVFFCVTFMKDDCDITMNCTQERLDHSITVMDSARETNATLTVTYETCFDDDPEDLELRYTYSPEDGTSNPPSPVQFGSSVMDLTNVTTTIEIQGLMDSTTYEYTVSLVRTVGGGTIGKTISADFHTGGGDGGGGGGGGGNGDGGAVAAIAGGVAGGVAVIVPIAAVVAGVLCYCHSRGQTNKATSPQPEAEYEEIPGEAQGAIEMKENTAYGPVTARGGPVYEVPGGGGQTANEGIETGGNIAYGHVHY